MSKPKAPSTLAITPATQSDLRVVVELARRIWPRSYARILTPEQIANMLKRIYTPAQLSEEMAKGHRFWIARENEKPLGYASACRDGDAIWLKKLYVLPGRQKQGIGHALMEEVTHALQPAIALKLLVNRANTPAQRFYLRRGFTQTGELPVRMGDYEFVDLIFSKPIAV